MLSPLDTDEGLQALAVIRDVTERRAIEERIRQLNLDLQLQNARLETVNTELEAFSYSVSHDLRAPLRHIDGFASLLSKHASEKFDETGLRYLGVISDAARRMGRLIDDLLTFSRMSRTQLDAAEVDQDQLIADAIREPGLDRPGIEWRIAPLPRARADAAMLRQVWLNLLSNAVKYSARTEHPRIEVGSLPDPDTPGGHVFFVRDNGVGFDMKYAAKLFGVFQRLHSEAEFEGTGIGLANVRRIVARHGGRTWAESTIGSGATFFFSLPPSPPDASPEG
jgi:light-regulated signal transduction histidine kinase (bacteriophytochrome)